MCYFIKSPPSLCGKQVQWWLGGTDEGILFYTRGNGGFPVIKHSPIYI